MGGVRWEETTRVCGAIWVSGLRVWGGCEDRVRDGPASGGGRAPWVGISSTVFRVRAEGLRVGVHHAGLRGDERGGVVHGWLRVVDCLECLHLVSGWLGFSYSRVQGSMVPRCRLSRMSSPDFAFRGQDLACLGLMGSGLWGEGSGGLRVESCRLSQMS